MNYIGEKIKELRRRNNITQEKLAELLGITYQTVSKWECGVSSPDIYLLAPIARLFEVSADELLGITDGNAKRAGFDAVYDRGFSYWLIDEVATRKLAAKAVAEFPGEMRYLLWLAQMEVFAGGEDDLEKAVAHCKTVIENAAGYELKNKAIYEITAALNSLGRSGEAMEYAEMIPNDLYTRDDVLKNILNGDEQLEAMRRIVYDSVSGAVEILARLRRYPFDNDANAVAVLETQEALIKALIPDGNYIGFYTDLWTIYAQRAELAVAKGDHEKAISYLKISKEYLDNFNALQESGALTYTCPFLSGIEDKNEFGGDRTQEWRFEISECALTPLHDRDDFKELLK